MIGSGELIVILCVILILFGGKKLPEFARNLGRGFHEFKKACQGVDSVVDNASDEHHPPADTTKKSEYKELPHDH